MQGCKGCKQSIKYRTNLCLQCHLQPYKTREDCRSATTNSLLETPIPPSCMIDYRH